ncbi:DUF5689 domain-containing protein [Flavobacterium myungsuense]|uniref:DUF5689 domain-containing protein n=1 Tax=Flavobacterium myungsuense TaxID=651823 RepID=A0ABW3J044_9FLAO
MKKLQLFLTLTILASLSSCINSDEYSAPDLSCSDLTVTKQVKEITDQSDVTYKKYENTDVIEAYVTSSDEGGNFFKSISLVSTDGKIGFSVPVDAYNLYTKYEPGRKVFINMKDRYYVTDFESTIIGSLYDNNTPANDKDDEVGRISGVDYQKIITSSCTKVNEDAFVNKITIAQAKDDSYLNKLIEFDNVQFKSESFGKKYYDASLNDLGGATNHNITDEFGNTIILRVSSFAVFASKLVPNKNGKIRGVLTKFRSDYQFMVRTENDIQLIDPLLSIDFAGPIVGNAITYSGSFTENFESYGTTSPANRTFPKYINDPVVGTRYWENKTFGTPANKYIQMTSFGGTAEANRSLFFIPVDMTAANTFSFQSKSGFTNGNVLKVYYSIDYVPGTNITDATLIDITSNFTVSPGLSSGYPTTFTNSGNYNIPAGITGNGFFIFEYVGSGLTGLTSTMQIDNIIVN